MAARLSLPAAYSWQPQTIPQLAASRITDDLVEAIVCVNGVPTLVTPRVYSTDPFLAPGVAGTPAYSKFGRGILYNGSTQYNARSSNALHPLATAGTHLDECTFLALLVPAATASTFVTACSLANAATGTIRLSQSGTTNELRFGCIDNAGTTQNISATSAFWANGVPAVAIGTRSESANFARLYCSGSQLVNTTATALGNVTFNKTTWGCWASGSPGQFWNGSVYLTAFWRRALQPAEIAALSANPWQIFDAPSRPIFISEAAGGGAVNTAVTLSAASFSYTPTALAAKTNRFAVLSSASFAYTPQDLTARYGRNVTLSAASFSYTPQPLSAKTNRLATLSPASYAYTLTSLAAQTTRKATLSPASFVYTPTALEALFVGLIAYEITLSPVSFAYTPGELTATYRDARAATTAIGGIATPPFTSPGQIAKRRTWQVWEHPDSKKAREAEEEARKALLEAQAALEEAKAASEAKAKAQAARKVLAALRRAGERQEAQEAEVALVAAEALKAGKKKAIAKELDELEQFVREAMAELNELRRKRRNEDEEGLIRLILLH